MTIVAIILCLLTLVLFVGPAIADYAGWSGDDDTGSP